MSQATAGIGGHALAAAAADRRIADIHGLGDKGGEVANVRHEEFMAMTEAFLGPGYDPVVLAQVESLQLALHEAQAKLCAALQSREIDRIQYVRDVNRVHAEIARQCAAVLGREDFAKLFGDAPSEAEPHLEMDVFLAQPDASSRALPGT